MIVILSPAKALDYATPPTTDIHSLPIFKPQAAKLIQVLRRLSPVQVAELMTLSDGLAALNVGRYAAWSRDCSLANSKQAVLAFNGDVYHGLSARELDDDALAWAQEHLRILSGLYGVLRPLDLMQPYRLEMGTPLVTVAGGNLYEFWGERVTKELSRLLRAESRAGREPVLLNLASEEYFKVVRAEGLAGRVVKVVFEDWKDGRYRVISFFAKRARGRMARHLIDARAEGLADVQSFDADGYRFHPESSGMERLVFRRREVST